MAVPIPMPNSGYKDRFLLITLSKSSFNFSMELPCSEAYSTLSGFYSIPVPERSDEVITICKSLIEGTKKDDVKYDAYRILAQTYRAIGEYGLAQNAIEQIPEIYFTKLELAAQLLKGEEQFRAANIQKELSAYSLLDMLECLAEYYQEKGEPEKAKIQLEIAQKVTEAFREDFVAEGRYRTVYQARTEHLE